MGRKLIPALILIFVFLMLAVPVFAQEGDRGSPLRMAYGKPQTNHREL